PGGVSAGVDVQDRGFDRGVGRPYVDAADSLQLPGWDVLRWARVSLLAQARTRFDFAASRDRGVMRRVFLQRRRAAGSGSAGAVGACAGTGAQERDRSG